MPFHNPPAGFHRSPRTRYRRVDAEEILEFLYALPDQRISPPLLYHAADALISPLIRFVPIDVQSTRGKVSTMDMITCGRARISCGIAPIKPVMSDDDFGRTVSGRQVVEYALHDAEDKVRHGGNQFRQRAEYAFNQRKDDIYRRR